MNNVIKLLGVAAICSVMAKACAIDHTSQLIENVPDIAYGQISSAHPEWKAEEVASFYYQNEDSINNELKIEAEYAIDYAEYKREHPEDFAEEAPDSLWEEYCREFKIDKNNPTDEDVNFYLDAWLESQNY